MDAGQRALIVAAVATVAGCASILGIDKDFVEGPSANVPDARADVVATPDARPDAAPADAAPPIITALSAGFATTCAITSDGSVACWGDNQNGEVGDGTTEARLRPTTIALPGPAVAIATSGSSGGAHTCALLAGVGGRCWGAAAAGQLGTAFDSSSDNPTPIPIEGLDALEIDSGPLAVPLLAAGLGFTCATRGGPVFCWGTNDDGQLGDDTTASRATPAPVVGLDGVRSLVAGRTHACALTAGDGAYCWGANSTGQLGVYGLGSIGSARPRRVYQSGDAIALVAGDGHTCMLRSNGRVACWGNNGSGQLGVGDNQNRGVPVNLPRLGQEADGAAAPVVALGAGAVHTCALIEGGAAFCWGNNESGQLGDGTTVDQTTPVRVTSVAAGSGARALALGSGHTCALFDGTVKCWGKGGRLGNGTDLRSTDAVPVTF